jgi:hypothetical protein
VPGQDVSASRYLTIGGANSESAFCVIKIALASHTMRVHNDLLARRCRRANFTLDDKDQIALRQSHPFPTIRVGWVPPERRDLPKNDGVLWWFRASLSALGLAAVRR